MLVRFERESVHRPHVVAKLHPVPGRPSPADLAVRLADFDPEHIKNSFPFLSILNN